nr:hypothetical protein Iba_chr04cCG14400 [Ipomoea batatas]
MFLCSNLGSAVNFRLRNFSSEVQPVSAPVCYGNKEFTVKGLNLGFALGGRYFSVVFWGCSMVGNRNQSSGRTQNGISKKNSSGVHGNNGKTAGNSGRNLGNLPASAVVNTGDESVQPLESNSGNVGQNSVRESANGNNEQNQTNSSNTAGSDALNRDVMNSQGPLKNVPLNLMAPGRHAAYGKGIEVQRAGRLNGDRTVRNSNLNVDQNPEKNLDRNYQNKQNKQSANPGSRVMNEAQNCGNNPASSEQNEQIGQSPLPAASGNRDCSEQTVSRTLGSTDTLSVDGMNEEDGVFGTRQSKWIPKQNHNLNLENNLKERETEKGKNQNEEQKDNDNVEGDPVAETVLVSEENQGVEQERASDLGQNTNCQTDMVEHSEEEDGNTTEYEPESDDLSTEYEEEIEEPTLKANNRPNEGSHTCSNMKSVDGGNAQPAEELFGTQEEGIQNRDGEEGNKKGLKNTKQTKKAVEENNGNQKTSKKKRKGETNVVPEGNAEDSSCENAGTCDEQNEQNEEQNTASDPLSFENAKKTKNSELVHTLLVGVVCIDSSIPTRMVSAVVDTPMYLRLKRYPAHPAGDVVKAMSIQCAGASGFNVLGWIFELVFCLVVVVSQLSPVSL